MTWERPAAGRRAAIRVLGGVAVVAGGLAAVVLLGGTGGEGGGGSPLPVFTESPASGAPGSSGGRRSAGRDGASVPAAAPERGESSPVAETVGAWEVVPTAPISPRAGASAVWTGEEVWVWGGRSGSGWLHDGAAYDPAAGAWRRLPDLGVTVPAAAGSAVWVGDRMVVVGVGGQGASGVPFAGALGPGGGAWEALPPPPVDGWTVSSVSGLDGAVIVVGPVAEEPWTAPDSVAVMLDLAEGTWRILPAPPLLLIASWVRATAHAGGLAVLAEVRSVGFDGYVPAVSVFDPRDGVWSTPVRLPADRSKNDVEFVFHEGRLLGVGPWLGSTWSTVVWALAPDAPDGWEMVHERQFAGRARPHAVSTRNGLVVWEPTAGGVVYPPGFETASPMPEAPLSPRDGAAVVGTGSGLFVWGGESGGQPVGDGALWQARR